MTSKKFKWILLIIFTGLLLFTRFYNLEHTTRFTRDESSNLMDMHRIFVERKLTLIGPIDVNNIIIYPSLTFYMLLPFSIIDNFTTWSPATGTAFYGIVTIFILLYLTKKINSQLLVPLGVLFIVWHPLLETNRWAWNPHLVPFMQALALFFWFRKTRRSALLAGIFFGLAFHLHYFSVVSFIVFGALSLLMAIKEKKLARVVLMGLGAIITLVPFIIFDLRNPPGLFFGKFLSDNLVSQGITQEVTNLPLSIVDNLGKSLIYLSQSQFLAVVLALTLFCLIVYDLKNRSKGLVYLLPVFAQIAAISFLPVFAGRYFLLAIVFFVLWLMYPRGSFAKLLVFLSLGIVILGGLKTIQKTLTVPPQEPGAYVVEKASSIIANSIAQNDLKNVNLAVIGSLDPDLYGVIYRHTLLVKETRILSEAEYQLTDNLFVISTSSDEEIKQDKANIIDGFRNGEVEEVFDVPYTSWKVYLFNRD